MTKEEKDLLMSQREALLSKRTGDIFQDGDLMDEILKIETKLGIITPNADSPFECEGCGS